MHFFFNAGGRCYVLNTQCDLRKLQTFSLSFLLVTNDLKRLQIHLLGLTVVHLPQHPAAAVLHEECEPFLEAGNAVLQLSRFKRKARCPLRCSRGCTATSAECICAAFYLKKMLLPCFMMSPWPNGNPFSVRTARAPQRSIAEWQQHPMQPLLSNKIQLSAGSNFKVFNPRSVKARYFQWGC